ncbi:MAG TPA: NAD(P)-dependent oxidoreductase [Solirubrobacteraceae bacterium]|jgi:D-3-phosphoglycerate dehydrogenase|nr:NAD(P)-dependent oxidoreductase [Solirubrobacteraceae bacterium]
MTTFSVAVDRGIRMEDGSSSYPLDPLQAAGLAWSFLDETVDELAPAQVAGRDAVVLGGATLTAASLQTDAPPLLVARLGAGFDTVDIDACTERGVLVTTAPDGVKRAMAASGILAVLALAHRLIEKEHRTRAGTWDRTAIGQGIADRTLGVLGLGNIGRELCAYAAPFPWRRIGHDKYAAPPEGVEPVDLETLLRESDYLVITLPLSDETHHVIDADKLALMKPTAYLVNIARGPVVDQAALTTVLTERRIAGAALDVFEHEPLTVSDPLIALDNVILTGHDIGLTRDMTNDTARSACTSVIDVAQGRVPARLLNRDVLDHPRVSALRRP